MGTPPRVEPLVLEEATGVPAGTEACVMSIAAAGPNGRLSDAAWLVNGEGASSVSAAQPGVPATAGPPAFTR